MMTQKHPHFTTLLEENGTGWNIINKQKTNATLVHKSGLKMHATLIRDGIQP